MLEDKEIKEIERKIGYTFKYKNILIEAFTRSSYANEEKMKGGKGLCNEQLEFYGDSVLNYVIVKELSDHENFIDKDDDLIFNKTEGELTNFVSYWSNKMILSSIIEKLELNEYLIMNKGDKNNNNSSDSISVKEDLFESIIGAIWFDSGKNLEIISPIIVNLLNLNYEDKCFEKSEIVILKEKIDKLNSKGKKIKKVDSNNQLILYDDGNIIFQEEIKLKDYNLKLETYQKAIKLLNNYKL